jgi:GTP cyclohydrolase I
MATSVTGPEAAQGAAVPAPARSALGIDTDRVAGLIAQLLVELGEDPTRDGLIGTPGRVAAWWKAFLSPDGAAVDTCFTESQLSGQLVIVGGMNIWSLCIGKPGYQDLRNASLRASSAAYSALGVPDVRDQRTAVLM